MKRISLVLMILLGANSLLAQTVLSGSELFGKDRKEGFYLTVSAEKKFVEKDWALFLAKYGRVIQNRDVYNVAMASIPDLTSEPVNLMTKVASDQKAKTRVFASFDIGGTPVASSSGSYYVVERIMKEFNDYAMQNEDVRLAEKDAQESQKNMDRIEKTGKRIVRDIERNKREKESLLKKIEENKVELEKLLKEEIDNKQDFENAKIALDEKQKAVSTVKTKKQ